MNLLFEHLGFRLFWPIEGAVYFAIIATVYFALPKVKARVVWLVLVSYLFYMYWNPVFIVLIFSSTLVDYLAGRLLEKSSGQRRNGMLGVSILLNLGILGYFKYYNFLVEALQDFFGYFNLEVVIPTHSWLLPVGISFYTFQTLSYTIDVYRGKLKAASNFFTFALYVAFFPQLIAGPIERATNLLPQFRLKHHFNYERVRSGLFLILFGLFKKIVIADRFAVYVDQVFANPTDFSGISLILGIIFFGFQIYGDFSGYTDMAIGAARVLGFDLMDNFKGPYWSSSIQEFWRRWHISLSTWFRDYLYIPLGGNRKGTYLTYRNLTVVFLITGLWHGANWTFVAWGIFHGFFLILERIGWKDRLKVLPKLIQIFYTFAVVSLGWVFFRADTIADAWTIFGQLLVVDEAYFQLTFGQSFIERAELYLSIALLLVMMFIHYFEYLFDVTKKVLVAPFLVRWSVYLILIYSITLLGAYGEAKPFIYFQF